VRRSPALGCARGGAPEEATMDWMSAMLVAVIVLVAEALGMSFTRS
jgi:hypothetical protein